MYSKENLNFITNFGKLIDPLADKATQIAVLASLTFKGIIPLWILLIVFIKEFVMVAGASFLYGKKLVVSSRWYGKLATVLFYVAIVCSLFIEYWNTSINPAAPLLRFDDYIYYFSNSNNHIFTNNVLQAILPTRLFEKGKLENRRKFELGFKPNSNFFVVRPVP